MRLGYTGYQKEQEDLQNCKCLYMEIKVSVAAAPNSLELILRKYMGLAKSFKNFSAVE